MIALPVGGSEIARPAASVLGDIQEGQGLWGPNEKGLRAPRSLLKWLVCNIRLQHGCPLRGSPRTVSKRRLLIERDNSTIAEAIRKLDRDDLPGSAWYILEGLSYPDVFIRTPSTIIVIEGKRTEPIPTRTTTWMPVRDQLLRHIDCAWEIRGSGVVLGFLIVEGNGGPEAVDVPQRWMDWAQECRSGPVLEGSLPHRSESERTDIASGVLGVRTWQRLCAEFDIPWTSLPDHCS